MSISTNNFSLNDAVAWYDRFIKLHTKINYKGYEQLPLAEKWRLNTETLSWRGSGELTEYVQGLYYAMFLLGESYVLATQQLAAENMDEFSEGTIKDLAEEISNELIDKAFRKMEKAEVEFFKPVNQPPKQEDKTHLTDATDLIKGLSDEQFAVLKKILASEELKRWKEKNGKKDF